MGLVASNAYLVVFTTGTFVGALSAYYLTKFRRKATEHSWEEGAEERFEVRNGHVKSYKTPYVYILRKQFNNFYF